MPNDLFSQAVAFAAVKHSSQTRKDGTPYVSHPLHVAEQLKLHGYPVSYQIAGVLHDVLEDTDATEHDLELYGPEVVKAVKLVTRQKGESETEYVNAILQDRMAAAVKNEDKIHNVLSCVYNGTPGQERTKSAEEFARRYINEAKMYYSGKFSQALDRAVIYADNAMNNIIIPHTVMPAYSAEEAKLYIDIRQELDNKRREAVRNSEQPDIHNKTNRYYYDGDGSYFCVLFNSSNDVVKMWLLTQYGWMSLDVEDTAFIIDIFADVIQIPVNQVLENNRFLLN